MRVGAVDSYHYDFYAQALAKLERGHTRDVSDVQAMVDHGLVEPARLLELLEAIRGDLIRYPAIDAEAFAATVRAFVDGLSSGWNRRVIDLTGLPAADRIERGLVDLAAGIDGVDALLVAISRATSPSTTRLHYFGVRCARMP